jgi:hypothetical protein
MPKNIGSNFVCFGTSLELRIFLMKVGLQLLEAENVQVLISLIGLIYKMQLIFLNIGATLRFMLTNNIAYRPRNK